MLRPWQCENSASGESTSASTSCDCPGGHLFSSGRSEYLAEIDKRRLKMCEVETRVAQNLDYSVVQAAFVCRLATIREQMPGRMHFVHSNTHLSCCVNMYYFVRFNHSWDRSQGISSCADGKVPKP